MKRFFKWLLLLFVVLAVGVVFILYNPHVIKGPLERYLSGVAGYTVSLDGELDIDTGRLMDITARNIHVSGPEWAARENLVVIGRLDLVLNTASIFKDIVLIESLLVENLQLNLETDEQGTGNWMTASQPSSHPDKEGVGSVVVFNDIQVRNAAFWFRNGKTGVENNFTIESLSHQQQSDGMLHTTLNGDLNKRQVEYTHTIGPYKNILDGHDISYRASGHFGELALQGNAYIDNLLDPKSPEFNLDMQGPNIDEITAMLGINDLGGGGFSLQANGARTGDEYEAEISGKIGDVSLSASAQFTDIEKLNHLELDLAIDGPSLDAVTSVFGMERWPDKPFNLKGQAKRVGGTLNIPNLTLDVGGTTVLLDALLTEFPSLEAGRVKLQVSGDEIAPFHELLGIKGVATGPFDLRGNIKPSPDGLELLQVKLETSLGKATISGSLGGAPSYTGSKINLQLDGSDAHSVLSAFGIEALPHRPYSLSARLEVAENGFLVERGALLAIDDERLELAGFIALGQSGKGTNVDVKVTGEHLASVTGRHLGEVEVPDSPYEVSSHIKILEEGIQLDNLVFGFQTISLNTDGLIKLGDGLSGTALNFQLNGENLTALEKFPAIGDSLDIFVPGQSYQAAGRFEVDKSGWKLEAIKGRVGKTSLEFDAFLSKQADRSGSSLQFSARGPSLSELLIRKRGPGLADGAFDASAQIKLAGNMLSVNDLSFDTPRANGKIDLALGWPYESSKNISFKVNVRGDDIRDFLPPMEGFEPEVAAFQINAAGDKRGDLVDIKQFESNIGNLQISLAGRSEERVEADEVEVAFNVVSQDISQLGRLYGEPLPTLPLEIKADLKGNAREFGLRNLAGSLGNSHLTGVLDVSLKGPKPDITLTATSDYIDIRPFLNPRKGQVENDTPPGKQDRLIPPAPLPLDFLAASNLRISLDIAELRYPQDSITELVLELEQKDGSLNVSRLSYEAPRGKLNTSISIHPTQSNNANVKIDLNTEEFVFNFSGMGDDKLDQIPAFNIDFHANGTGGDLQQVAGSMNGSLYIGSKGGSAENVDLSALDTFILEQIFSTIMPKSKVSLDTQFNCIAGKMDIVDGQLKTTPALAFSTRKIAVVIKGTLDLKTEKMNFNFNSTPTKAMKISAGEMFYPYILIGGTLAEPEVGVDPGKAVLYGGAAVATLGISVLAKGVLDRAGNAMPVCEDMLNNPPEQK